MLAGGSSDGGHSDHVVLDSLAALRGSHRRELSAGIDPGLGQEVIAVLGGVSPTSVEELIRYRPRGMRSLAVLLDVNAWAGGSSDSAGTAPEPEDARRLLSSAGWGVAIAKPSASMQQVWQELCASASHRGPSMRSEVG